MEARGGEIAPLLRQLRQAALAPRPQDPRPRPADRDPPRLLPEQMARRPQLAARVRGLERVPRARKRLQQTPDLQHEVRRQRRVGVVGNGPDTRKRNAQAAAATADHGAFHVHGQGLMPECQRTLLGRLGNKPVNGQEATAAEP